MTGRDHNQALAQHAAELGLDYTPGAIREIKRKLGPAGARDWMSKLAALLTFADYVFVQDAAVPFTQDQAAQTLRRASGNLEHAKALVRRRAIRAVEDAQLHYDAKVKQAWAEAFTKEARERHARLHGAYEHVAGTLGHRFTAVMGFLADADISRDRYRIAAEKEVSRELDRLFPHPGDQDARQLVINRYGDLGSRLDYCADYLPFRARIEDLIAESCEQLAEQVQEGWRPDPLEAVLAEQLLTRYWLQWRTEHRRAAA